LPRLAALLTFASALSILVSIRVSQLLLGAAWLTLIAGRVQPRFPRLALPLGIFLALTLVSLAGSPDPAQGLPQVKKIYVYTILIAAFTALRDLEWWRRLAACWTAVAAAMALVSCGQFFQKWLAARAAGRGFYEYYIVERTTGLMSHWMTFGGEQMIVLLWTLAVLLFAPGVARRRLWAGAFTLIALSLALGMTRGIWLGALAGSAYLLWRWRRAAVWWTPCAALLLWVLAPARTASFVNPAKVDSNQHRIVTWRTGLAMIRAHPWRGLGPEFVNRRFHEFVPAEIPRPLPDGYYGHLHNFYLHYAAERGLPALVALLAGLSLMFFDFRRALARAGPARRYLLEGATAVGIAIMVTGLFEHNLGDSEVLTLFLVSAAAGYVAREDAWHTEACALRPST
jgi:putative inorganic carbon (HCO3(-)) transporter